MATFAEHVIQSQRNLLFLQNINKNIIDCWDWQVTSAFYSAVHYVNAHIASQINQHYRSHEDVDHCINPYGGDKKCKFPEAIYLAYKRLQTLSRRSRYLCGEKNDPDKISQRLTYDVHLAKAITNLDAVITHLNGTYPGKLVKGKIAIVCVELKKTPLNFFIVS